VHVVETPGDVRRPKHHHKYDERSKIIRRKFWCRRDQKKHEWRKRTRSHQNRFRSGGGEEKFYEKKRCRGRRQNASLERTDDECNVFTLSSADQIIREEEYERQHSVNARNAVAPKNTKQQQKGKKKERDASTSRASSTSPAPSLARAQHQHSSMNPSGSMPQYLGVPQPKSLSVLRRDAGESSLSVQILRRLIPRRPR